MNLEQAMARIAALEYENSKLIQGLDILMNNWNRDVTKVEAERDEARARAEKAESIMLMYRA